MTTLTVRLGSEAAVHRAATHGRSGHLAFWHYKPLLLKASLMILEVAPLQVRAGQEAGFEAAFKLAQAVISSMPGYVSHELQRCVERSSEYILLVRWESLEAHEVGFRQSAGYQEWKKLLHHFYDPLPVVSHYVHVE
jgi:heme-degrading monooxygenase HmoA